MWKSSWCIGGAREVSVLFAHGDTLPHVAKYVSSVPMFVMLREGPGREPSTRIQNSDFFGGLRLEGATVGSSLIVTSV